MSKQPIDIQLAPLPVLDTSIAKKVLLEIYRDGGDDIDMEVYLEQQLAAIKKENRVVSAVLELIRDNEGEANGEEAGQAALIAGVAIYQVLSRQTQLNYQKIFLRAKLKENKEV